MCKSHHCMFVQVSSMTYFEDGLLRDATDMVRDAVKRLFVKGLLNILDGPLLKLLVLSFSFSQLSVAFEASFTVLSFPKAPCSFQGWPF